MFKQILETTRKMKARYIERSLFVTEPKSSVIASVFD
ncbi:MAG: hypothetical protein ACI9ES_001207 [Oceanospirillaceae bacterium]|jgi:hypothetical protein